MACSSTSLAAFCLFLLHLIRGGISAQYKDDDYLGLALNLEYLETEFFLNSALGYGLDVAEADLAMGGPSPIGAKQVRYWNPTTKEIITEFGYQEMGHLRAIKDLIKQGFARPLLNLSKESFADIMNSAFGEVLRPPFDPYANEINNLLASYVIPYVGLTGYVGATSNLQNSAYKKLVAGLLGVESGQDAVLRSILFQFKDMRVWPYIYTVANFTNKISALRNKLGDNGTKDEGLVVPKEESAEGKTTGNILAGDKNSVAYDRTPEEVLRIVYGSGNERKPGGFFPEGGQGKIANKYLPKF